jgi:hypothetical protein
MSKTYILIDDEAQSAAPADGYAEELGVASRGQLQVRTYRPSSLADVLEFIAEAKPDGLLLDIALTNTTVDGEPLAYDGIALAQQIRTLQTRGLRQDAESLPEFPLIRFSKTDVIREYVGGDTTSDDLFDEKVDKSEVIDDPAGVARRALSLAIDYPKVCAYARSEQSDEALANLLGCSPDFFSLLDARALVGFRRAGAPAHVLSRYVTGALLARPGPLVEEALLSVRLGIDSERSGDWAALRAGLERSKYRGAFAQGYERWWMPLLLDWWSEEIDADHAPYRLSAAERVKAIARKTGLGALIALPEDPDSPGLKFWHRCLRSDLPVDPAFGFPLMGIWGQETWQDVDYLCLEEARRDSRNPRLRSAERSRLASLRAKGEAAS